MPGAVDAVAPMCIADSAQAEITMAGDFLWGMKTFFNPAIKGTNYSAGQAGYVEMLTDLGTVLTTLRALSSSILLLIQLHQHGHQLQLRQLLYKRFQCEALYCLLGLMSGIPTQSNTYDASSGPAGASETTFGLVLSPALAVLENGAEAADPCSYC